MRLQALILISCLLLQLSSASAAPKAKPPTEDDYYPLINFPLPEGCQLEVGGLAWLDKQQTRLLACTRRGELWVFDNVYTPEPALPDTKIKKRDENGKVIETDPIPAQIVRYKRMLFGLHEPLGVVVNPGHGFPDGIYMAQRGELTRCVDENGDDRIDLVECFAKGWEISGGYHEFAFGPKLGSDGMLWVTINRPFGEGQEGSAYWRGWALRIDNKGEMHPVCPGLRSPAGLGPNAAGDMFFTDNQGDWTAACKISQLKEGVFQGEAWSLRSCDHPKSNFKNPGPGMPISGLLWPEAMDKMPWLQPPAVWFPYPQMGQSHTDILWDSTGGKFGPFAGQTFVGDLSSATVIRVFMEKVDGEYQGACFPFRRGIQPPVLRMLWGKDGSMFLGGSSRGWGGGARPFGLSRMQWSGKTPFEMLEMRARHDGFTLVFTQPVDPATAGDVKSYAMTAWTYHYHSAYGDKVQDEHPLTIKSAAVSPDGKSVTLQVDGLARAYVHQLEARGVRNTEGLPLLHPIGYYTLTRIPK